MGVAHTLTRRMFWSDNILWKEDVEGRGMTVMLSEKDIVVDTKAVGRYLTRGKGVKAVEDYWGDEWRSRAWSGDGLDVLWFEGWNHGEVLDTKEDRETLIRVLMNYSKEGYESIPKRGL